MVSTPSTACPLSGAVRADDGADRATATGAEPVPDETPKKDDSCEEPMPRIWSKEEIRAYAAYRESCVDCSDGTPVMQGADRVNRIMDRLYLGDKCAAQDKGALDTLGITHVVNAADELNYLVDHHQDRQYMHLQAFDNGDLLSASSLQSQLDQAVTFIEDALAADPNNRVYVHCFAGVSRSVSVVLAYLMQQHCMTFDQALTFVRQSRPCANPNRIFQPLLRVFEQRQSTRCGRDAAAAAAAAANDDVASSASSQEQKE